MLALRTLSRRQHARIDAGRQWRRPCRRAARSDANDGDGGCISAANATPTITNDINQFEQPAASSSGRAVMHWRQSECKPGASKSKSKSNNNNILSTNMSSDNNATIRNMAPKARVARPLPLANNNNSNNNDDDDNDK